MDLLNLLNGFVKVIVCILPFAQQNQAEVWPSYALSISGPLAIFFFTYLSFLSESS